METEQQLPPYGSFYYGYLLDLFIAVESGVETLTKITITQINQYKQQGYWLWQSDTPESAPPLTALHSVSDGGILYALMQTVGRGE